MSKGERRKWERLEHGLRVQLQVLGPTPRSSVVAIGTHLSPEGIFVQVADPPPPDSHVRVSIGGSTEDSIELAVDGVVINQSVPDDGTDQVGIGIEFSDAGAQWRKLYDWLNR